MTATTALVVCLALLVGVNLWVHVGDARWQPLAGPVLAALFLLVGRWAGLSWEQLGLGRGTVARGLVWGGAATLVVAVLYALALALPRGRALLVDERHRGGARATAYVALVAVPLGTVAVEEVAFRGVLWGLLDTGRGPVAATAATALLFGAWHVLPAVDGANANAAGGRAPRDRVLRQVAATVAVTTVAGVVLAALRHQSGSLLAPVLLHWAANGLGAVAAAVAGARAPRAGRAPR